MCVCVCMHACFYAYYFMCLFLCVNMSVHGYVYLCVYLEVDSVWLLWGVPNVFVNVNAESRDIKYLLFELLELSKLFS